jgi:ribonucleotide reductase alpha subunit
LTGESLDDLVFEDLPPIIEKEPEEEVIDDFENPFQEIDSEAIEYLEKRKVLSEIKRRNIQVYQAKNLNVFDMYLDNFIIFPLLREDGTWFGFQGRSLVGKQFITKLFDESLPKAWNIFQTDKTKEVFVCESIFDALSTGQDNSMAVLGSSSEILSKYKRDYVICLDNYNFDMKAKQSYRKYVDEGFKAFMWPKEIEYKDFNEMLVNGNFKPEQIKILINENIEEGLPAQVTLRF